MSKGDETGDESVGGTLCFVLRRELEIAHNAMSVALQSLARELRVRRIGSPSTLFARGDNGHLCLIQALSPFRFCRSLSNAD